MMDAGEILVPLIVMATIFGIIFVVISARNRERMAMIEKGVNPQDFISSGPNVYGILKWALLLVGLGLGLFIGNLLETYSQLSEEASYFASALFFGGVGLVVAFLITKNAESRANK